MKNKMAEQVEKIHLALMGDYQRGGFISNTENQLKEISESIKRLDNEKADKTELHNKFKDACYRLTDLEKWKKDWDKLKWKVITAIISALSAGLIVGYLTHRFWS